MQNNKFTIIEYGLVLLIFGGLAAIVIPRMWASAHEGAKPKTTTVTVSTTQPTADQK